MRKLHCTSRDTFLRQRFDSGTQYFHTHQNLNIFNDLKKNLNIGLVLISHNIGVIAETSNAVLVMKDGQILESGDTIKVLTKPKNEYTKHLLSCIPPWIGN